MGQFQVGDRIQTTRDVAGLKRGLCGTVSEVKSISTTFPNGHAPQEKEVHAPTHIYIVQMDGIEGLQTFGEIQLVGEGADRLWMEVPIIVKAGESSSVDITAMLAGEVRTLRTQNAALQHEVTELVPSLNGQITRINRRRAAFAAHHKAMQTRRRTVEARRAKWQERHEVARMKIAELEKQQPAAPAIPEDMILVNREIWERDSKWLADFQELCADLFQPKAAVSLRTIVDDLRKENALLQHEMGIEVKQREDAARLLNTAETAIRTERINHANDINNTKVECENTITTLRRQLREAKQSQVIQGGKQPEGKAG